MKVLLLLIVVTALIDVLITVVPLDNVMPSVNSKGVSHV